MSTWSLNQHCGHLPQGEIFLKTTLTTLLNNQQKVKINLLTLVSIKSLPFKTHVSIRAFLGAFANFEKRLSASSLLSLRPSAWNNTAPTGRIFMKIYEYFLKINPENPTFFTVWVQKRGLYMNTCVQLRYLVEFSLEWEMFQTKIME